MDDKHPANESSDRTWLRQLNHIYEAIDALNEDPYIGTYQGRIDALQALMAVVDDYASQRMDRSRNANAEWADLRNKIDECWQFIMGWKKPR